MNFILLLAVLVRIPIDSHVQTAHVCRVALIREYQQGMNLPQPSSPWKVPST